MHYQNFSYFFFQDLFLLKGKEIVLKPCEFSDDVDCISDEHVCTRMVTNNVDFSN